MKIVSPSSSVAGSVAITAYMVTDVALVGNDFQSGPNTGVLPAGKYLLQPKAVVTNGAGAASIVAQVHDGAAAVDTCKDAVTAAGRSTTIAWGFTVEHAAPVTYTLQCKDITTTASVFLRSTSDADAANVASQITAIRVA